MLGKKHYFQYLEGLNFKIEMLCYFNVTLCGTITEGLANLRDVSTMELLKKRLEVGQLPIIPVQSQRDMLIGGDVRIKI